MAAGADSVETALRSGMAQTLWSGTPGLACDAGGHRVRQHPDRRFPRLVGQGRASARADPRDHGRAARGPGHRVPPRGARRRAACGRRVPAPLPPERLDRRRGLLARGPLRRRERPRHRARASPRERRVRQRSTARLPPHRARRERDQHGRDRVLRESRLHDRAQAARPHALRRPEALTRLYPLSWTVLGGEVAVPCHPQAALAGLNSHSRGFAFGASTPDRGVDGRVPRGERSRTRSDPGGSSLKRYRSCAADQPGRSRRPAGTPGDELRRWVHGPCSFAMGNADVIRELARRWNAGDVDGVLELYTEDAVMLSGEDWPEQTTWQGREGIRSNIEDWRGVWESSELEIRRLETFGDKVVAEGAWNTRGRSSGLSGSMPATTLCTTPRGKIASLEWFTDYDAAVAATRGS